MDLHYQISTILLIIGFGLYTLGISSTAWKFETGYEYGLWYRCGKRECVFNQVDYFGYMNIVRIGILIASILLVVSCVCLLVEVAMVITRSNSNHKHRLGRTVIVMVIMAELTVSGCLGYYGYKTLIGNEKLPSLGWGFASTGGGIIALFLGTIVRLMGPSSTWSRIPCLKNKRKRKNSAAKNRRQIYKPNDKDQKKDKSKNRPTKLHITHPTDIITYRKASEPLDTSCENLLVVSSSRQNSACSSPKYEELNLNRDFMIARRGSNQKLCTTSSNHPSPRLVRDLSPRKSSSLPPGISPGFYAHVHRNQRVRTENKYEAATVSRHTNPYQSIRPSPRFHQGSPFRPIRVLTVDSASIRSAPTSSPPPSPPLPPPPPPLLSTATVETVNIRQMNSIGRHRHNSNTVMVDYAPSPSSLHSFGSYGY